jgi:phospholipase C
MKSPRFVLSLLLITAGPAFATVTVSQPANGTTVTSPANYVASATTTCAKGVAAMGIYVNNSLVYTVNAASLNTSITLGAGKSNTVVQEWDKCGGASSTPITVTVAGPTNPTAVTVNSPANGATVSSPVNFVASATTSCTAGIAATGIYVNGALAYKVSASSLNTSLALSAGTYSVSVQEWDNCGSAAKTPLTITVPGATTPPGTQNGVVVTAPTNGSTVTSPVTFTATGGSTSCAAGIAAMGIYVNNSLAYKVSGSSLNTQLPLSTGAQHPVVQQWDNCGGASNTPLSITVAAATAPTISFTANPSTIAAGATSNLAAIATNATGVTISGSDGTNYTLGASGGTQPVSPSANTTYTATATGSYGHTSASVTLNVESASDVDQIQHVVFMLQENHTFDNYFGMLNPYRQQNGWNVGQDGVTYNIDGIDDKLSSANVNDEGTSFPLFKLKTTCVDDLTSAWLESYGDVSRYNFSPTRSINMDGFVHTAEGYAKSCTAGGANTCAGTFTDTVGQRAMGYYDQGFLNYYYYMASQFAVSDRWFSPISSKSIDNRIATFTGGTTQGLVFDPGNNDHQPQLAIPTIFGELDKANVSWKIYYTVTQGSCLEADDCSGGASSQFPASDFTSLTYSVQYLYENPTGAACKAPTQASSAVGDASNSFCIDTAHIAPLSQYYTDLTNGTLPSYSFIEAGYGHNDEHPGSGQSILAGQQEVANVVNAFMTSPEWSSSVFFLSYDEGGGPYEHVPPVPGKSNQNTDASLGPIPDISSISVNADNYNPCLPSSGTATLHCDLNSNDPGAKPTDAAAQQGFAAQLGFRVPNMIISPFTRMHYVSHTPMDHTAILKFVENRFIGPSAHLTARDAAQPNLLEFFDFTNVPWKTPPTPPTPVSTQSLGYNSCTPASM